ncbi:MAG: LicD family protein [Candidatus Limivicinus sp.]|jgi:phosphorylcholine metabolism protein LicD
MNYKDFFDKSVDYLKKDYNTFIECQKVIKDIFSVFNKLCQDHNIPYAKFFGSLIGEIRDGGMIPWDPDMDVCVAIDQIPHLIEVLSTYLPDEYFFISNFTDPEFKYFQIKIGKKGYDVYAIHLDVFYLLGVPANVKEEKFLSEVARVYFMRHRCIESRKSRIEVSNPERSLAGFYARKLQAKIQSRFLGISAIDRKFNMLCNACDYRTSKRICVMEDPSCVYNHSDIEPMKFEFINGQSIGMPSNPVAVLNSTYEKYMEYPSIETCFDEYHDYMKWYRKLQSENNRKLQ